MKAPVACFEGDDSGLILSVQRVLFSISSSQFPHEPRPQVLQLALTFSLLTLQGLVYSPYQCFELRSYPFPRGFWPYLTSGPFAGRPWCPALSLLSLRSIHW